MTRYRWKRRSVVVAAVLLSSLPATGSAPAGAVAWRCPSMMQTAATRQAACIQRGPSTALITNSLDGKPIPKTDTTGKQLDAHEGTIVYDRGLYWMVGNTYGCGYQWIHAKTPWCGFRAYTSPDLVTWTDRGLVFNPNTTRWQTLCGYGNLGCFNPRLIRNAYTGLWVMWFNAYYSRSGYIVMTALTPAGPFTEKPVPHLAVADNHPGRGNGAGGLYLDRDGKGYLAYTAWTLGGSIVVEQLDARMLNGNGKHAVIKLTGAEAPSLFREPSGSYAITYDDPGCAWCGGTGTAYATSPTPFGPWTLRGRLSDMTCGGQAAGQVAVLPTRSTPLILFTSDQFTNLVSPRPANWSGMTDIRTVGNWNQTNATQHWEPLVFGAGGRIAPLACPGTVRVPVAPRR